MTSKASGFGLSLGHGQDRTFVTRTETAGQLDISRNVKYQGKAICHNFGHINAVSYFRPCILHSAKILFTALRILSGLYRFDDIALYGSLNAYLLAAHS